MLQIFHESKYTQLGRQQLSKPTIQDSTRPESSAELVQVRREHLEKSGSDSLPQSNAKQTQMDLMDNYLRRPLPGTAPKPASANSQNHLSSESEAAVTRSAFSLTAAVGDMQAIEGEDDQGFNALLVLSDNSPLKKMIAPSSRAFHLPGK